METIFNIIAFVVIVILSIYVYTAQSNISSLTNANNDMRKQLDATKAELDATKAELDATKAELNSTKAELDATKAELDATKAELNDTKTALNATKTELDDTKKDLKLKTLYLDVTYLHFAKLSGIIRNEILIRNEKISTIPPIFLEIDKFIGKYFEEKAQSESLTMDEWKKIESELKSKLDKLTSLDISGIELVYK